MLDNQTKKILSFMFQNGFPNYISKLLLCCLKSNSAISSSNYSIKENDIPNIIFCEQLLNCCLKKVKCCLNLSAKFRVPYNTKEISFYVII